MPVMADKKMTKSAGEHWVCSVLSRMGWAAALTRDGIERTDILAVLTDSESRAMIEVQVKATADPVARASWFLGKKSQQPAQSGHEWYVLVAFGDNATAAPHTYIVPRNHVAAGAWISHMNWLTDPDAKPGTRNADVDKARVTADVFRGYEDRWDLLERPTNDVPVLLPGPYHGLAVDERVGLPPDHPWHTDLPRW